MKRYLFASVLLVLIFIFIFGCNQQINQTQVELDSYANMNNPASEYCLLLGGQLAITKVGQGEIGICKLADGELIEEWLLYQRDHKHQTQLESD